LNTISFPLTRSDTFSFFHPVALQSLKDLGRLTYRSFLKLFRHIVGLLGRVISPSQGLYLHRTTQHRKTLTNIHALSGIRTHDPSNQPAKTDASDRTATVHPILTEFKKNIITLYFRIWALHFKKIPLFRDQPSAVRPNFGRDTKL
jgi:hypothetical protein